jgi:hypothetical protein
MADISPALAHRRGRFAALSRAVKNGERPSDDPDFIAAGHDLAYEGLAEHAARVVAQWPTPTNEQLQRVAAILRAGGES